MTETIEKALLFYHRHLQRVRAYNETHREQINSSAKASFQTLKEDPEKYKLYKEKKREQYRKLHPKKDKVLSL
jgi:hypothetical protein